MEAEDGSDFVESELQLGIQGKRNRELKEVARRESVCSVHSGSCNVTAFNNQRKFIQSLQLSFKFDQLL